MTLHLQLTEDEYVALRERADAEGISMEDVARRALLEYIGRGRRRDRVSEAAERVVTAHRDALYRLGR